MIIILCPFKFLNKKYDSIYILIKTRRTNEKQK